MQMNVSIESPPVEDLCKLLSLIGQPARIQILLVIGTEEVCVCHMEAALDMRQASISQHLMTLRKAGLVSARREGRNIYYHLVNLDVLDFIYRAARLLGSDATTLQESSKRTRANCPCLKCNPTIGTCD
jgi:DNA-binding transcriptional ArsR family regulator